MGVLRIAVVSCGSAKLDHAAPARDIYTGSLFRAARDHVEAGAFDAWFIVSALHGVIPPWKVISPYEQRLDDLTVDQLTVWGNRCDMGLRLDTGYGLWTRMGGEVVIEVHAGRAYVDRLRDVRGLGAMPWRWEDPLAGLQIGERLGWYRTQREATRAAA